MMYSPGSSPSFQHSYFSPSSPTMSASNAAINQQHVTHFQQHKQTPVFQHTFPMAQNRYSRKHEDAEPMTTSPVAQHQGREFLPSFLTGDSYQSSLSKPITPGSPDRRRSSIYPSEIIRSTPEKFQEQEKNELLVKQGPPISGIGRVEEKCSSPLLTGTPTSSLRNLNSSSGFIPSYSQSTMQSATPSKPSSAGLSNLHGKSNSASTWVTVFGFPGSMTPNIIAQFSLYGTILESRTNPGSNWIHLKYSNTIETRRALSKNGTIMSGAMMVGVIYCDEDIATRLPPSFMFNSPYASSPTLGGTNTGSVTSPMGQRQKENVVPPVRRTNTTPEMRSGMRPMGRNDIQTQVPRQKGGLLSWAVDSIFGW